MKEIWYYDEGLPYPEKEPNYYKIEDFPELEKIEKHWPEIKQELCDFIHEKDKNFLSNSYQNVDIKGGWNSLPFVFWGLIMSNELYKKCPVLTGYLKQVKGLTSLSLSQLLPNSSIGRHRGDTNAVMRCHLGIEVPAKLPVSGLKVGEEEKGWEEGKWTLFNDAYIHSAWNNSDKRRIVLILDTVRPEFSGKKNSISATIISYQVINNKLGRRTSFKDSSFFTKKILFPLIYLSNMAFRPIQNLVKITFS